MRLLLVTLAALAACAFAQSPTIDPNVVDGNTIVGISVPLGVALCYSAIIVVSLAITGASVSAAGGGRGRIGVLAKGGENIELETPTTGAKGVYVHGSSTTKRHESQVRGSYGNIYMRPTSHTAT